MEVIKDYTDLSKVSLDKLHKLQDVAESYRASVYNDYLEADSRVKDIQLEISTRMLKDV